MTAQRIAPLRAGVGTGLLLAATILGLISVWPDDPLVANTAWYTVTAVRATGLAAWAWLLGSMLDASTERPVSSLTRLAIGAVVTAPIEALAHAASAPIPPLAWSLTAPLLIAWGLYGVAWLLSHVLRRLGWTAVLAPLAVAAAAGLLLLDVRLGLGWWTPWTLTRAPAVGAAALGLLAAGLTWAFAWRDARRAPPEAAA